MTYLFSSLLIGFGQTCAVLVYFLYRHPDAFQEKRARVGYTLGFYLLLSASQALLHRYVSQSGMGSLPTLPFLALTWVLYSLFVFLWSRVKWEICCFVAFVLLLVDNCIWPLIGGLSRAVWGLNYLYEGSFLLRVPFILVLCVMECALTYCIRRMMPEIKKIRLNIYDAILAASIVLPFLYIRILAGQSAAQEDKTVQIVMTLCCLIAVVTLAASVGRASGEYEKMREEQMRSVLRQQQAMFEQKLHDADTVSRKYHDMKNFLLYLRSAENTAELTPSINRLMESIEPYEAGVSTGNSVLDVIMSEKLAVCTKKEIACIPYLDGTLLDFVEPLDLCTLVGNAMDNAIESCVQIAEKERRLIRLHTLSRGGTVLLTVRNTFSVRPNLRNGLPSTTKADAAGHGYGMRNMRYITSQYNGSMSCQIEGEEFVLNIMLEEPERR